MHIACPVYKSEMKRPLLILIVAWSLAPLAPGQLRDGAPATSSDAHDVVESIDRFYGMSPEAARAGTPVRIEATILYSDSRWNNLWLYDGKSRMYLEPPQGMALPRARRRVILSATTELKKGRPVLRDIQFRDLGVAELPPAKVLNPTVLLGKESIGSRVSLAGTVVHVSEKEDHLMIIIAFLQRFQVRVIVNEYEPTALKGLLGAHVAAAGCSSHVGDPEMAGIAPVQVYVPNMADVNIFRRGPVTPFNAPLIRIASAESEYRSRRDQRLVRAIGTLRHGSDTTDLLISDQDQTLKLNLNLPTSIKAGTQVQVAGIVWREEETNRCRSSPAVLQRGDSVCRSIAGCRRGSRREHSF